MSVWNTANSECSPDLLLQLENWNWWIILWHRVIKHQILHSGNDFIILIVVLRGVAGFRCLPAINGNLIIRCSRPKMWGNVNWNKPHLLRVKRSKYCQQCWNHIFGWQIILEALIILYLYKRFSMYEYSSYQLPVCIWNSFETSNNTTLSENKNIVQID